MVADTPKRRAFEQRVPVLLNFLVPSKLTYPVKTMSANCPEKLI